MSAMHGSFTIARDYDAPVAMVFKAWADRDAKARWFVGPADWQNVVREQDFRVGGRDRLQGHWRDGTVTDFQAHYLDIVANKRIVYVYDMFHGGKKLSVSLATIEIAPEGKRTRMTVTEQGVFLDGYEDKGSRKHGIGAQMDLLAESLES
jgi:uncharacterized protein YndB with AHSA1/START domain